MKVNRRKKPRQFAIRGVKLQEAGTIHLSPGEVVTFVDGTGKECDFTAAAWGYYVAPSLNGRLKDQGYKAALVLGPRGKIFLMAVDSTKTDIFRAYLKDQKCVVLCWLDEWAAKVR